MAKVAHTAGCEIYCGDDLMQAAASSRVARDLFDTRKSMRMPGVARVISDLRNAELRTLLPRACVVSGTERDSGRPITIGFTGTLRVVGFCAPLIIGNDRFERTATNAETASRADILVSDHALAGSRQRRAARIRLPTWVRQALPIREDWATALARLPSGLRQELRRFLRRYGYTVAVSSGPSALRSYYRDLHVPYLSKRFGDDTILASERAFLTQYAHMTRLDLLYEDRVVAASLLELRGPCLAIRASSMAPDNPTLSGRADVLDYFSMLIAKSLDCNRLDFGLSRPHLENGSFRYKAKWCSSLSAAGGLKTEIRILPRTRTDATLAFLRRNYFLQRGVDRYFVRVLRDREDGDGAFSRLTNMGRASGQYDVLYTDDPGEAGMVLE